VTVSAESTVLRKLASTEQFPAVMGYVTGGWTMLALSMKQIQANASAIESLHCERNGS